MKSFMGIISSKHFHEKESGILCENVNYISIIYMYMTSHTELSII